MILKSLGHHILGAGDQHCLTVQLKEIRAFPHHTEAPSVGGQDSFKFPCKSVRAAVEKDLPVMLRCTVTHHTSVCTVRLPPYLGITKVKPTAVLGKLLTVQYRIARIFLIIQAISHRNTLCLHFPVAPIRLILLDHACIHQQMFAIGQHDSTARKTAVPVIIRIRRHCRRQLFPVQQILAHCMAPVHGTPIGTERMILIEHMIFPFVIRKTVGVVHPSHPRGQMKIRPRFRRDLPLLLLLIPSCIP